MLQSNNLELNHVDFVNNTAGLYGGSIYLGENHVSVLISSVTVRGSSADSGGGLYLSRFSTNVRIISCDIRQNKADEGGGLASFVEGLTIRRSTIANNVATTSCGGILVEDTVDFLLVLESSISGNIAESSGGLGIIQSFNITIESCELVENKAVVGGGGALSLRESETIVIRNTSFVQNDAADMGGAGYIFTGENDAESLQQSGFFPGRHVAGESCRKPGWSSVCHGLDSGGGAWQHTEAQYCSNRTRLSNLCSCINAFHIFE